MAGLEIRFLGCLLGLLRDSIHIGGRLDLLGTLRVWFHPGFSLQAQKESGGGATAFRTPSGQPRTAALLARLSGGEAQFPGTPVAFPCYSSLTHTEAFHGFFRSLLHLLDHLPHHPFPLKDLLHSCSMLVPAETLD